MNFAENEILQQTFDKPCTRLILLVDFGISYAVFPLKMCQTFQQDELEKYYM